MDKRIEHRLAETNSQNAVNGEAFDKIGIEQTNRILPVGDLNRTLNVAEQFNLERQNSTRYRLNGTISSLFTNVLFNSTGPNSKGYLLTNELFRDRSYPPTGVNYNDVEDLKYVDAYKTHVIETNGWYNFKDPNVSDNSLCMFYDFEPKRELFEFAPKNKKKNWELTITYPASSATTYMTQGGLLVIEATPVSIGNRPMTAFATPVKHGLSQGDTVRLKDLSNNTYDDDYPIVRVGLDNGDLKDNYFVVDIDPATFVTISNNTRMSRMVSDEETIYYYRKFEKVATVNSPQMEDDDYDIYNLNFSKGLYNDVSVQFVVNEDIDIEGLTDNLGRPLSELYLTIIKTKSKQGFISSPKFTKVKSGIEMPFIGNTNSFETSVPDIRRIHNGTSPTPHTSLDNNVLITDSDFYGDVVSYNRYTVKEVVLGEIRHRFNTPNRELGGTVSDPTGLEAPIDMGQRQEGYFYKPHWQIKIREYSNYIEQGDSSTGGIPSYAEDLEDGRWLWRDLLDIGFSDVSRSPVDYPFLNGCHYIHQNYCIPLRRQDPFAQYGLYYGTAPRDAFGDRMSDNFKTNRSEDAC